MATKDYEFRKLDGLLRDTEVLKRKFAKLKKSISNGRSDEEIILSFKNFWQILRTYKETNWAIEKDRQSAVACIEAIEAERIQRRGNSDEDTEAPQFFDKPTRAQSASFMNTVARASRSPSPSSANISPPQSPTSDSGKRRKRPRVSSDFEAPPPVAQSSKGVIPPRSRVAARIPGSKKEPPTWILASVVRFLHDKDRYEVEDEDPGDEYEPNPVRKHYTLASKYVAQLPSSLADIPEYKKDTKILAMFPQTTSFYPAVVVRKTKDTVSVRFADDEDDEGQTPARKVDALNTVLFPPGL